MSKLVLVDCISQFRMRYLVEAPDDHPEWALDTVTCQEAKEFSQSWIGEAISGYRVVSEEEALRICDEDNNYAVGWDAGKKKDAFFTSLEEQGIDRDPDQMSFDFYKDE